MSTLRRTLFATPAMVLIAADARAGSGTDGLVTVESRYPVPDTIARFSAAVVAEGWVLFGQIDHAEAANKAGLEMRPRTVVLFGNPAGGTAAMIAHPTLALDLPMRVLVWQDDAGRTRVTRSTGADIATRVFARHGVAIPAAAQASMEAFLAKLTAAATG
jgi:uncharacterized protein (DUF302 family)